MIVRRMSLAAAGAALFCGLLTGPAATAGASSTGTTAAGSSPGITATSVHIGQISDISAPVPGLFKAAADGTKAYVDYINSKGGINGRKLIFDGQDSDFNSTKVISTTTSQAKNDFALVGGYSLLDAAEQPIIDKYKVPDVAYPLSQKLAGDPNVYSPSPSTTNGITPTWSYAWAKKKFGKQMKNVGELYSAATPSTVQAEQALDKAMKASGIHIGYERGFSALESTFTSDVLKMKNSGILAYFNQQLPGSYAATLAQESELQDFKPTDIEGIAAYINNMQKLSGGDADGMYLVQSASLFQGQDAKVIPEVALFDKWVKKVDPKVFSLTTTFPALDGWASGMLFAQALKAAGANPTRASLVAQLNKVTSFDADGLLPPGENPAKNIPSKCGLVAQFENGNWKRINPTPKSGYICNLGGYYKTKGWHAENR